MILSLDVDRGITISGETEFEISYLQQIFGTAKKPIVCEYLENGSEIKIQNPMAETSVE